MSVNNVNNTSAPAGPSMIGYTPNTAPTGGEILGALGSAALSVGSAVLGTGLGGGADFALLMREQNRIQRENLMFSTMSNSSKAEHDTKKTIVSNWRAG